MLQDLETRTHAMNESAKDGARKNRNRLVKQTVYSLITLVILVLVGRELGRQLNAVSWKILEFEYQYLAVGVAGLALNELFASIAYVLVLRSFGARLPALRVLSASWAAALGKYIPGTVTATLGLAGLFNRFGVQWPMAASASIIPIGLTHVMGILASLPILFTMKRIEHLLSFDPVWLTVLLPVPLAICHPRVFRALANTILVRLKLEPLKHAISSPSYYLTLLLIALRFLILGLGVWCIARAMGPLSVLHWPWMVSVSVCASIIGTLAVFAPAGIGVREGIYMLLLGDVLGQSMAALLAVVLRLIQTVLELLYGAAGVVLLRSALTQINMADNTSKWNNPGNENPGTKR